MDLSLGKSEGNQSLFLSNQCRIIIDPQLNVVSYSGDNGLFCREQKPGSSIKLKDLLPEKLFNNLSRFISESAPLKGKVISQNQCLQIGETTAIVRFTLSRHKDSLLGVVIETMALDDHAIIFDKKHIKHPSPTASVKWESSLLNWRAFFEHNPISSLVIDHNCQVLAYNHAFVSMFGLLPDDSKNFCLAQLSLVKESFVDTKTIDQLLNRDIMSFTTEKHLRKKNGEIWVSIHAALMYNSDMEKAPYLNIQFQDITKDKELECKLSMMKAKYDVLLSNTNNAVFLIQDEQLTYCNPKAYELFECEDFQGRSPFYFSPQYQSDKKTSKEKIEEKLSQASQGQASLFQWDFQKTNGELFEAEVNLAVIKVDGEDLLQAIVHDITDRKERERAVRESESRFKGIFEGAGIGIGMTDPYGKMIESNQALEDLLGYKKEELLGKAIIELVHPDDRDFEKRYLMHYQNMSLKPGFFEKRYIRKDGNVMWGKLTTSVIYDERGIPAFGIGMLEDITQRKHAEEKVKENQELLNRVNENLTEGIYRSVPGKGLIYVNKAFAKMFGYDSVAEAMRLSSDSLNNFYDEENRRKKLLKEIKRKGYLKNKESLFRRKDGSTFWGLENSTVSTTAEGGLILDGVVVNITEKKQSEELLKSKNEELKKINEELDRFVYSASHDLRAPLTSLLGLINIAQSDRYINGIAEHLELMRRSVLKLDSFIIDIINYSRNARLDIEVEEIDLKALVTDAMANLQYVISTEKIEKRINIVQKVPLYSDSKRITILLNNLISNAIRYHNLILDDPYIEVKGKVTKKKARIDVIDNGKGIGKQYLNNIFAMFFRASDDSKGSGLGLYIVKETVAKLNGKISVTSEVGEGSTFSIVIPNLRSPKNQKTKKA